MTKKIIQVENLSKRFVIREASRESYVSLRDIVSQNVKNIFSPKKTSTVSKEDFWALKDVNFEVEKGDRVGIIGRNGAGKSTLLKILSRITEPSKGRITIRGKVASLLEVGTGFHPELTGRENIYLNGAILGMSRAEIRKKFDEIVDFAEVERFLDTPVKRYSSGMYVRLAFSVAAHLDPEILIVDEVLSVGDAEFQKKCLGKMNEVSKNDGRTILFVSHDLAAINRICESAILMNKGKVIASGAKNLVLNEYTKLQSNKNEITFDSGLVRKIEVRQTKDELVIVCQYVSDDFLKIPCLGFVISDYLGHPVFGATPQHQPPLKPLIKSKSGEVKAVIKYPKLLNGDYLLSIWFGDGLVDYFVKTLFLNFNVLNMVRYDVDVDPISIGVVSPVIEWEQTVID